MSEIKFVEAKLSDHKITGCRDMGDCDGPIIEVTTPHSPKHVSTTHICRYHARQLWGKLTPLIFDDNQMAKGWRDDIKKLLEKYTKKQEAVEEKSTEEPAEKKPKKGKSRLFSKKDKKDG